MLFLAMLLAVHARISRPLRRLDAGAGRQLHRAVDSMRAGARRACARQPGLDLCSGRKWHRRTDKLGQDQQHESVSSYQPLYVAELRTDFIQWIRCAGRRIGLRLCGAGSRDGTGRSGREHGQVRSRGIKTGQGRDKCRHGQVLRLAELLNNLSPILFPCFSMIPRIQLYEIPINYFFSSPDDQSDGNLVHGYVSGRT